MSTETITRIKDVRKGDIVTLERNGVTVTGPMGTLYSAPPPFVAYIDGVGTLYGKDGWTLISATREVPEVDPIAPGTAGTATVRGVEGVRVMRTDGGTVPKVEEEWFSPTGVPAGGQTIGDVWFHPDDQVTDFVPDVPDCGGSCESAIALRRDVKRLTERLDAMPDVTIHSEYDQPDHVRIEHRGRVLIDGPVGHWTYGSQVDQAREQRYNATAKLAEVQAELNQERAQSARYVRERDKAEAETEQLRRDVERLQEAHQESSQ